VDVSVILATYNRSLSLQSTLETFSKLVCPADLEWELIVVDNHSDDATKQVVDQFAKSGGMRLRYLFEKQQCKSAALNTGIAAAQSELIAFTDDDVQLHPGWLVNLVQTFQRFDCAAVAGRVVPLWRQDKPGWLEMDGQQAIVNFELGNNFKEIQVPPIGANFACRRTMFAQYGPFRLDLGVRGSKHTITCEDTEFSSRLIKAGERIIYCPDAIVYHPVDPNRATKKYFVDWYYYNGVSLTRSAGLPNFGVFYFGIPRWLYRELMNNVMRWAFTFETVRRFKWKLRCYRSLGTIVESYRLSKATKRPDARQLRQQPE
jgi:glycosyltransferase involved in cell wall biosynthesis